MDFLFSILYDHLLGLRWWLVGSIVGAVIVMAAVGIVAFRQALRSAEQPAYRKWSRIEAVASIGLGLGVLALAILVLASPFLFGDMLSKAYLYGKTLVFIQRALVLALVMPSGYIAYLGVWAIRAGRRTLQQLQAQHDELLASIRGEQDNNSAE